ncbi:MAG: DNA polymerase IV [Sphaerochaetaceae bacterium]|nr:DNA polymerase IV [Sphaerochaetaceae bacterium]
MPLFFHVDLDAFFASVEQRDNPQYRGKPLIIGLPVARSVVSTCSYEARKYGVHSAMPALQAKKLCPSGIFIAPNMKLYSSVSRSVMTILKEYSPVFHQVSIDEARLDMTGTGKLFGPPKPLAMKIKERVKEEIGITMSVGIASSPFIAKMASDYNKPDGLCMVSPGYEEKFIDAIGLEKIWGIGKSSIIALNSHGLYTPSQARNLSLSALCSFFGKSMGTYVYKAVRGEDPNTYEEAKSHSISTETTFFQDVKDSESLHRCLLGMSQELMGRSLDEGVMAKTVGLKLRWGDFSTITVQTTPSYPVLNADQIYSISKDLLSSKWKEGEGIRLIGLGLYQTYEADKPLQDSLFSEEDHRKRDLDKVIHALGSRGLKLQKASELDKS